MYFDRPTVFATEDWCTIPSSAAPGMSFGDFAVRVRARLTEGEMEHYPDIVREAFRNIPSQSSDHEHEVAVGTAVRNIQSRRSHAREIVRRHSQTLKRNIPTMQMERRANGD